MVRLFKGTCQAVRAMHDYHAPIGGTSSPGPSRPDPSQNSRGPQQQQHQEHHSDDDEETMFPHPEGDEDGGYSYGPAANVPLMTKHRVEDEGDVVFDGDEELSNIQEHNGNLDPGKTELVPYAHRDLKPGCAE